MRHTHSSMPTGGSGEADPSTAVTEPDAWRQPGSLPGHRLPDLILPASRPSSPPPRPAGGPLARPAAVTGMVLAGMVLTLIVLVVGGMTVLWASGTPTPQVPGLGPFGGRGAPAPEPLGNGAPGRARTSGTYTAVYEVTGVGEAHIAYTITKGYAVAQLLRVTLPWRATVQLDADVGEVTLRAIAEGTPPDGFGCTLAVDADVVTDTTPDEIGAVICQIRPRPADGPVPPTNPEDVL